MQTTPGPVGPTANVSRLLSLDALRGVDMLLIVGAEDVVTGLSRASDGPAVQSLVRQFTHKQWEGFGFYDLIFPLFVFLAGISLVYSLDKALELGGPGAALVRVLRRAALLYLLGVFYYGGIAHGWDQIRWVGVLQRIAISYLFAAIIYLACRRNWKAIVGATVAILVAYWAIMSFIPTPGREQVSFAEGVNLANYIDLHFLPGKRWDGGWDPEGILSSLPAVASCLLGVLAGLLLKNPNITRPRTAACFLLVGAVLVLLGFTWGLQFPVIKKLWTSSYVLVAGGYSLLLLGAFYLVIDVWKLRRGIAPLVWVGSNALTVYLVANIIELPRLAERLVGGEIKARAAPWGEALVAVVALFLVLALAGLLYRRRVFLRV